MPLSTKRSFSEFVSDYTFPKGSELIENNIPRNASFKLLKTNNCDAGPLSNVLKKSETITDSDFSINSMPSTIFNSKSEKKTSFNNSTENDIITFVNEQPTSFITQPNYRIKTVSSERKRTISRPDSFSSSKKHLSSKQDLVARERCFDYIVQSIDEAWALYCDTTSSAEVKFYDNMNSTGSKNVSNSRISIYSNSRKSSLSDDDGETEYSENESNDFNIKSTCADNLTDDEYSGTIDTSGYKSETTNVAEYETDSSDCRTVSELPDCIKFQSLKCRLTKAKNDLEQYYDSKDYSDCITFWNRWDMIKYSAVEIMEDDDDDEVIESALEELEKGRCYVE